MPRSFDQRASIEAAANNRTAGASELLAELLPLLAVALDAGEAATRDAVRTICRGQPAMAPLWNACAMALADLEQPGRFARTRQEMARAPDALVRAAAFALRDAMREAARPQVLTLSYSASVARALQVVAAERPLDVVCAESLPGREGQRLCDELIAAGVTARVVLDCELTTYLSTASAVVVGADAVSARDWTNKAGTFGVAAAASFTPVPVYVVASRDKAQAATLRARVPLPRLFERVPVELVTLFLTDAGPVAPSDLPQMTERYADELTRLLELI